MSERHEVGELIGRAVELTASDASNPNVSLTADDLQNLVRETFATLSGLAQAGSRRDSTRRASDGARPRRESRSRPTP